MTVPGSNLLQRALGLVAPQTVAWAAFTGMTTNAAGVDVPTWAAPVSVLGSLQPATDAFLQNLGLDWTKEYVNFYASEQFQDPSRDMTGDRLTYAGRTYQVEHPIDWFNQDGWQAALAVRVTNV